MTPSTLTADVTELTKEVKIPKVRGMARSIAIDPTLNEGVKAMMERSSEMRSPMTALLAGIAALPQARRMWEDTLDEVWAKNRVSPGTLYPEVVIGSGLHAAIYCAMRAEMGLEPPIILEQADRVGGIFAASRTPTFYLNSRNRPGGLSIPRNQGALNFLPGAMVQPSDLSNEEYQVNSDLAFAIRSVYALTGAKVIPNARVEGLSQSSRYVRTRNVNGFYGNNRREFFVAVDLRDGRRLKAERVIVANGVGRPRGYWKEAGERLIRFRQFLGMLDRPFPFRGMRRVAVIGAGDSGKCVIEALTGQGPSSHMSVASLDWPTDIVWYGQESTSRQSFEECNRPRYKRIGTLLESNRSRRERVQARPSRVNFIDEGYDCVLVDGEPFDFAIDCTGYDPDAPGVGSTEGLDLFFDSARYMRRNPGDQVDRIYYIGPTARIPKSQREEIATPSPNDFRARREAEVAAYRYAGRTAMFAKRLATLDGV